MVLNINKKTIKKAIKYHAKLLANFRYDSDEKTEYNFIEWIANKDYNKPEFKAIFGLEKDDELTPGMVSYIQDHVLRPAWNMYWRKIHDRL